MQNASLNVFDQKGRKSGYNDIKCTRCACMDIVPSVVVASRGRLGELRTTTGRAGAY